MQDFETGSHAAEDKFDAQAINMINRTYSFGIVLTGSLGLVYLWGSINFDSTQFDFFSPSITDRYFAAGLSGVFTFLFILCKWLMRRGQTQFATRLFVFFMIIIAMVAVFYFNTGIYDPIIHLIYLALVIASVFLGRASLYLIGGVGIAFNFLVFYLIDNQYFETTHKVPTIDDVLVDSFILFLITAVLIITVSQILKNRTKLLLYQNHLEEIVAQRTAQYHAERNKAEAANRAKSQFLANMSHELRTPLNAIIGYSELIKETIGDAEINSLDDEVVTDIDKIRASGRHLLDLINNILDLSKIDAGKTELNLGFYSLIEIIDEVSFSIEPQILEKGLTFKVDFIEDAFFGELVQIDRRKVQQILINLLANAAKFTEDGQIMLTIEKVQVVDQIEMHFTVSDTGIGIDPEFIPNLFVRFEQEDKSSTRKHDGTGLGLAICNQLIEMMGGSITVESGKGLGASFFIRLPAIAVPASQQELLTTQSILFK